jgi:hypothetical protein
MKTKIILLILILFAFTDLRAQEKYLITWDYSDLSFKEFVAKTESLLHVKFFYKDEWVSDFKLGTFSGSTTISKILVDLFKEAPLYFIIDEAGNIVITKDFAVKITTPKETGGEKYLSPTDYSETQESHQQTEVLSVEIGNPGEKNKPGDVIVSGYLKDKDTKEPIIGVTVYVQKLSKGTISNEYGFYSLTLPRGIHLVQYMYVGMREKKINLSVYGNGELDVEMNSMLIPLKEAVVTAQKNMTLQRFEVGMEKLNIVSFRLMPTSMGETDIIKSVLLIPGVQSVGEGSSGFNVRGGSADQNLILIYGSPVYNSSHFFGFFSAVNSDIIKDVTLYKGGIPARYGGRISSVLDIVSKDGSKNEFSGNAGISPITTHFTVEGPIIKNKASYVIAARSTYSNWVLGLIDNEAIQNSRAAFYDINGRVTYDINKNNKLEFSSYLSHDAFKFNSDTSYKYNNNLLSFKWRHFFTNRFFSNLSVNNSKYSYGISSQNVYQDGFVLSHHVNNNNLKVDFNWYPGSRNEVNFGLDLSSYSIRPGSYLPATDSSIVMSRVIEKERALESALYIDDKFIITDHISLNLGVRLSSFFAMGPKTVMIYEPNIPVSLSSVIDTLSFNSNHIYTTYAGPELRMSLNFRLTDNSSIKLNYNKTRQYLHLLSNTTTISPTDVWKLSDYHLKPQIGDQLALGLYKMLFKNSIETSAEFYYKGIKNMIDYKGGATLIMNEAIEREVIDVEGKAYGMELMIKKEEGKLRWSVGYTYSRTLIRSISDLPEETINAGNWFPANFDKPHDLNLTFNYLLSRRFSISSNYTYSTGRPITYPEAIYQNRGLVLTYYSDRNKYRIPYYSRFDLAIKISGNLKSHRIAHPNWTVSIYNMFGRQNVYSIYFKNTGTLVKGYKLSIFGKAIPSVTYSFDF